MVSVSVETRLPRPESGRELKDVLDAERAGHPFLLYRDGDGDQRLVVLMTPRDRSHSAPGLRRVRPADRRRLRRPGPGASALPVRPMPTTASRKTLWVAAPGHQVLGPS